ncbi:MAG: histidinol-phosphate transaminase [Planctomycetaceae bacterium]|nr:histidinol-phosphate transaminase [Planctomycetaceae bacterium]
MTLFRPNIDRIAGYMPGEQPQDAGWVKLNTNENPYPPSPMVVEAIAQAARGKLNLYPDPLGTAFRKAAAEVFGVEPDWILPGNGSDENLTILTRAFADPSDLVVYPYPSYILYETLADLQGTRHARLLLNRDWSWNLDAVRPLLNEAKLAFVPNPNSPSGNRWDRATVAAIVPAKGVLVLDEAYGDFADVPHRAELLRTDIGRRVVITKSFSKSYSLAGIRFGFAIAHPDLIAGMRKVKDSYNCDAVSLAAATAAIQDQGWMQANVERIRQTRQRLSSELASLGFAVVPSQANFVWCTHPVRLHKDLYESLKSQKILVRYMVFPDVAWAETGRLDGLRITVGTDAEIDTLLNALREMV